MWHRLDSCDVEEFLHRRQQRGKAGCHLHRGVIVPAKQHKKNQVWIHASCTAGFRYQHWVTCYLFVNYCALSLFSTLYLIFQQKISSHCIFFLLKYATLFISNLNNQYCNERMHPALCHAVNCGYFISVFWYKSLFLSPSLFMSVFFIWCLPFSESHTQN